MSDLLKPTSEFERQISLLMADVGVPGSGAVRYAAAMYFHKEIPPIVARTDVSGEK